MSSLSRPGRFDDAEPLSEQWLREVCYAENREGCFGFDNDRFWFEIESHGDDCYAFYLAGEEFDGSRIKTRGDVRDLCWLIDCPWFSECWGEAPHAHADELAARALERLAPKMLVAIQGAMRIESLWIPGGDVLPEHWEEARALEALKNSFQAILDEYAAIKR